MKKLMMIAAMALMSVGVFAQEAGKTALGVNVGMAAYGNKYNPFGIGAKFQYEFVECFRAELAYNYWFAKDKAGVMDFDLNVQYIIPATDKLNIYPLVGANLALTHGEANKAFLDGQQSIFGFQGGAGIEYFLTDNFKVNFDVKYQYNKKTKSGYEIKYDGPVFQIGGAYVF